MERKARHWTSRFHCWSRTASSAAFCAAYDGSSSSLWLQQLGPGCCSQQHAACSCGARKLQDETFMDTIDPEVRADIEYAAKQLAKHIARRCGRGLRGGRAGRVRAGAQRSVLCCWFHGGGPGGETHGPSSQARAVTKAREPLSSRAVACTVLHPLPHTSPLHPACPRHYCYAGAPPSCRTRLTQRATARLCRRPTPTARMGRWTRRASTRSWRTCCSAHRVGGQAQRAQHAGRTQGGVSWLRRLVDLRSC